MGNAVVIPSAASASQIGALTPRSWNVGLAGVLGMPTSSSVSVVVCVCVVSAFSFRQWPAA
jgi:hypothetical protein